ncbi:hypothetical protein RRG08_014950 [Elysia crispata]|uniref:Uncharacterized protein n=1 Tax=Elysia crispata TaxID=231223 RepID=A0AAE1CW55_9GAST|nr:hypothetical protein RRG08_014950 [Elysia crispata]
METALRTHSQDEVWCQNCAITVERSPHSRPGKSVDLDRLTVNNSLFDGQKITFWMGCRRKTNHSIPASFSLQGLLIEFDIAPCGRAV